MSEAYDYQADPMEDEAPEPQPVQAGEWVLQAPQSPNLAFDLDDTTLGRIGAKVVEEYGVDIASRQDEGYDERLETAVKLAKLAKEAKSFPWEGASNVKYPLIIQAAIEFNSRTYSAVVSGPDLAKSRVLGKHSDEKVARGERVSRHMSYQLLEEEAEWEDDTDSLFLRLPIVGTMVRKRYFDPVLGRNCSHILGPDEFVVNYKAKRDLSVCPRMTQVLTFYPHEIIEKRRAGIWLDVELGEAPDAANDDQAPHTFLEQHRLWDLDEDGYPEPYIVTVHKETEKVVRIVARWRPNGVVVNNRGEIVKITPYRCFTKYGFIPSPDGSFYDIGFGTLLGPLSDTINTTINQIMDAGTLSNVQGGFIGSGISLKSSAMRFKPGEWKRVENQGASLKDAIVPLPVREPSSVLFSLMQFLIDTARNLTATQELLTGDSSKSTMPVGTTLALIEQGLKTYTAIVKRVHRALKDELDILFDLNAEYLDPEVYFTFQDDEIQTGQSDYNRDDLDIRPVSDPSMATDMQKMGRAQFMLSLRGTGYDDVEINKFALETAGLDTERFMPKGQPEPPPELVAEAAKLELEHRKTDIQEQEAEANIALKSAQAQKASVEAFLALPEFQLQIATLADQIAQQRMAAEKEALNGQPGAVQSPDLPGMGQPPPDAGVPPLPEGPAGPLGGPMGAGGGDGPPIPGQGGVDAGAFDPQLVGPAGAVPEV